MGLILSDPKPVEQPIGIVCLIVNILVPGVGVIIYNVTAKDDRWVRPFVEFFFAWLIIPWIIAIIDGIKIFQAAQAPAPAPVQQ